MFQRGLKLTTVYEQVLVGVQPAVNDVRCGAGAAGSLCKQSKGLISKGGSLRLKKQGKRKTSAPTPVNILP